jgi:adenylate kinase family enzyme
MERCDTVIWLDFPRTVCTWRVLKRILFYKKSGRPDMAEGCDERFDWEFLKYVWNFPRDKNPSIESRLLKFEDVKIFNLQSDREVEDFFAELKNQQSAPPIISKKKKN